MKNVKTSAHSQKFMSLEMVSAQLLFCAALLALFLSNSPWKSHYHFFQTQLNLSFLINEGLMTIFFLVVGLEVKYELLQGSLNSFSKAALPAIGALGGMLVPAGIYVLFNEQDAFLLRAWAVPTATDIAFSLAVLSFVGSRAPFGLKAYLTALAIFDDVAAIIIIAFFYTDRIDTLFLGCSLVCLFLLFLFNKIRLAQLSPYLLLGLMLWFCFLKAGIHPTLAGILTAFMVPLETKNKKKFPLQKLQQALHPWVAIVILPLFALMNAGVSFTHFNQAEVQLTVLLGTFFGLFLGKQLGIFGASWLAVKARLAALPDQIRWPELYAVAVICGIGFTISLFIGNLAFNPGHEVYLNSLKIGILTGSLLSGCIGYLLLLHLR